jgi:hypothetical protein
MRFILGFFGNYSVLLCGCIAGASEEGGFVASNLISIFYHEVAHAVIKAILRFPSNVEVKIEQCAEANAYYDPPSVSNTICTEFDANLTLQFNDL